MYFTVRGFDIHNNQVKSNVSLDNINCTNTRDVWNVRGLAAVRRSYVDGDGDYYAKL
jgi:hypothetical protein